MDLASWNLGFTRGERNRPADVVLADGICRQSYQNGYDAARQVKVENLACNGNTPDKVAADRRRARYLRGIGH